MIANRIRAHCSTEPNTTHILLSYHGLPQISIEEGDPYQAQCKETTRLIREHLGWDESMLSMSFQSRFGPSEWLQPYTDDQLTALAKDHVQVGVMCPGFATDCLETLEEVKIGYAEHFKEKGGGELMYITCANGDDDHALALLDVCTETHQLK